MNRETDILEPITFRINLVSTPASVFRAVTSQTELRKWWAPRVIMSRNTVSQEEGVDMEMRLVTEEKYQLVRYSWRGEVWPQETPATIITFEIHDLGVFRGQTGEGIRLEIIHDGWTDQEARDRQESIWKLAIPGLKALLEGRTVKPWWDGVKSADGYRNTDLTEIRLFLEKMEQESRGRLEKKQAAGVIREICKKLDGQGEWYMKENRSEFELRFNKVRLFSVMKNGTLVLSWRELERILGERLQDYASRLSVEQDLDLRIGKSQDRISAMHLNPGFWSQWCIDIIQYKRDTA